MTYAIVLYILAILLFIIAGFNIARSNDRFSLTDLGLACLAGALFLGR